MDARWPTRVTSPQRATKTRRLRRPARTVADLQSPPSRAPPNASGPSQPVRQVPDPDSGITCEADPEFLEHARREQLGQPQLP